MPRAVAIAWIAAGLLAALAPAAVREDAASNFEKTQAAQKIQQDAQNQIFPLLDKQHPAHPASDLLSLRLESGNLVLRTPLPVSNQTYRVKIGTQNDWSILELQGGVTDKGPPVVPNFFNLTRVSFAPQHTETLCLQQAIGSFLNFSLLEHTPTGDRTIQLQEQFPNSAARFPGGCQLVIMEMTTGHPWTPTLWNSTNFAALTLDHPEEVDRYLRPLLRQVDQDAVLTPDEMLAFQLFWNQWSADPAMADKVRALVAEMAGGDFHSRTRAQNELAALGKDAALVLIRLDRAKLGPEQNARLDRLLAPYRPMSESQAARLRSSPGFLANCLYSNDLTVRQSAFAQLLSVTKLPLVFDPDAAPAQRAKELSALLKQLAAAKPHARKP